MLLGAMLRFAFVQELSWLKYRYVLHAHSHVAMLGWVGQAIFILLAQTFVTDLKGRIKAYHRILGLAQLSCWGMLLSFPFYGYSGPSIAFSSLHILASYAMVYRLVKDVDLKGWPGRWLLAAMIFLVVSSLPLWGMAPIILLGLQGSALYYAAIQFFLHCQFNGWFTFSLFALLFHWMQNRWAWQEPPALMKWFFTTFLLASILTYALAVAWTTPLPIVFWANSAGVILQLISLFFLWQISRQWKAKGWSSLTPWTKRLLLLALGSFVIKVLVQGAVVVPFVAQAAYTIRNYVIGFIHLLQLGIFTAAILAFAEMNSWLSWQSRSSRIGLGFLFFGFLASEGLLFLQGTLFWGAKGFLPYYYETLFVVSALMPLGVVFLLVPWKRGVDSAATGTLE